MLIKRLLKAEKEAKEFLESVKDLKGSEYYDNSNGNIYCTQGKLTASVKRKSMDLSNALVEIRKSDYAY